MPVYRQGMAESKRENKPRIKMSDIEAIVVIVIVAWIGKHVLKGIFGFHSRSEYRRDR